MGGATYNSNPDAWRAQSRKYCGLEAQVTDPSTGKTLLLYIGDAFDDAWIKVANICLPLSPSPYPRNVSAEEKIAILTSVIENWVHRYHD